METVHQLDSLIKRLYEKDISSAYQALQELEAISENEAVLYSYVDDFLEMLKNEKYVIRVRGIRLLCKQAKWDTANRLNAFIDDILSALEDEKPTAVRQSLKALEDVVRYKKELREPIADKIRSIDCASFKDTMQGLIERDILNLLYMVDSSH